MGRGIETCLWFDGHAAAAAEFYVATFRAAGRPAELTGGLRHGEAGPGPKGSVLTRGFTLDGQAFLALNGGPHFTFTPAISLVVKCADQAEVDRFWTACRPAANRASAAGSRTGSGYRGRSCRRR